MPAFALYPAAVLAALCLYPLFLPELLCYQLSSYRVRELIPALRRKGARRPVLLLAVCLAAFLGMLIPALCGGSLFTLAALVFLPLAAVETVRRFRKTNKVKLRFTPRLIRFSAAYTVFASAACIGLAVLSDRLLSALPLLALCPVLAHPPAFLLTHAVSASVEGARNRRFIRRAAALLERRPDLIRIGITGSAGKTTAKHILHAFLSVRYRTLATEGNYNTPMGIALTVHRRLTDRHQILIAEMGARYTGDIRTLCSIVHPNHGLITHIGTQHLETFGSLEAIAAGKYELMQGLDKDGGALFNGDDAESRRLYDGHKGCKILYGACADAAVRCGPMTVTDRGTKFTLTANGEIVEIVTPLLGAHIPSVMAGCALMAIILGVTLQEIAAAAGRLKPVAHRLELLYNGQDIIIDDAYNANEQGAASALEVLAAFTGRLRVAVTPGLVELGERQREANHALGQKAAVSCDRLIVLGPNAPDIKAGALGGGMDETRIYTVSTLKEATERLSGLPSPKAVLFENDLPDNLM